VSPTGDIPLLAATPIPSAASLAPAAPTVVVSPLQHLVLHFLNCDIQLGLWKTQKSSEELDCLLLLLIVTLHHPHYSLAGACLAVPIRQAVVPVPTSREKQAVSNPERALLLPLPPSTP